MTIKLPLLRYSLIIAFILSKSANVLAEQSSPAIVPPYLLQDAPTLTHTLGEFEKNYNTAYPKYEIPPYREIKELTHNGTLYFASKINNILYSSIVLDKQTRKIKSLQLTYVPPKPSVAEPDTVSQIEALIKFEGLSKTESVVQAETTIKKPINEAILIDGSDIITDDCDIVAINYMTTLYQWFNPSEAPEYSQKEIIRLLKVGRDEPLYQEIINNLRYVVVDHGEKGITLAVEPIKQTASNQ